MKSEPKSEIILYQTEDNQTRIEVRLEKKTVWLTQAQLSELFQRERSVITKHIRNIFQKGELAEKAVCANYARTAADGKTYQSAYYNLDVIISVTLSQIAGRLRIGSRKSEAFTGTPQNRTPVNNPAVSDLIVMDSDLVSAYTGCTIWTPSSHHQITPA